MARRVLCVTSMYPPQHLGGYEVSCRDVMRRLAARGDEVVVLTSDLVVDATAELDDPGVTVRRHLRLYFDGVDPVRPSLRRSLDIERRNQQAVSEALAGGHPDVIAVWQVAALGLGTLAALEGVAPMAFVVCDDWLAYAPLLDAWTRRTERLGPLAAPLESWSGVPTRAPDLSAWGPFLFISEAVRRSAATRSRWHPSVSAVVYSGIDASLFEPARRTAAEWGGALLYVGRFDPRKGIETLVEAMTQLPGERLTISGTGDPQYEAHLRAMVDRLGLTARVELARHDRSELPDVYAAADAVVFPSEWPEPFGLVPLEAMACGTPVVASGTGGSGEFLRHGVNALLHRAGDAASIARAVRLLADDAGLRSHLVEAGVRTAQELDVERLTDVIDAWHAHVTGAGPRPQDRRLRAPGGPLHPGAGTGTEHGVRPR